MDADPEDIQIEYLKLNFNRECIFMKFKLTLKNI